MSVTAPASPFTPEGCHSEAHPHPRAGSRLVLDTPDPTLRGKSCTVIDWYDLVYKQRWKEAALGGDPLAVAYASRTARFNFPDNPSVVVVRLDEGFLAVHDSELTR